MTDNLGPLRQALADLSEHGGSTDMYERALRKSRQSQRRRAITATAVVVSLVAIGGTVGYAAAGRPSSTSPAAGRASDPPRYPDCPAPKTLENLVELPAGWSFLPSGVKCAEDWAAADVKRPAGGNIVYLFHYTTGTGWRYHDQGNGWACKDLGLTGPAPFCTS